MCFQENHKNLLYFWKKLRNKCFRSKYRQFSANFGQIFAFPIPRHLMTKDLTQIKVYTYFNIEDAKFEDGKIEGKVE